MASANSRRRLIVNADDFGRSPQINQAIACAHAEGILTSASLMVNESAAGPAAKLAREFPRLGVGLHLALADGRPALPAASLPRLTGSAGAAFDSNPVRAGLRYFFNRSCRDELKQEIRAQFEKFEQTGLMFDHVNGHLNFHLHPVVLEILAEIIPQTKCRAVRVTRDLFWLNARLARGRWGYRLSHAIIFNALSARARARLAARSIRFVPRVFGLLQTGAVNEAYLLRLLPRLPEGDAELYAHPNLAGAGEAELKALSSPAVRQRLSAEAIELIRYQDL